MENKKNDMLKLAGLLSNEPGLNQWVKDVFTPNLDDVEDDRAKRYSLIGKLGTLDEIINAKSMAIKDFIGNSENFKRLSVEYNDLLKGDLDVFNHVYFEESTNKYCLNSLPLWGSNKGLFDRLTSKDVSEIFDKWWLGGIPEPVSQSLAISLLQKEKGLNEYMKDTQKLLKILWRKADTTLDGNNIILTVKKELIQEFIMTLSQPKIYHELLFEQDKNVFNEVELEPETNKQIAQIYSEFYKRNIEPQVLDDLINNLITNLSQEDGLNDWIKNIFTVGINNEHSLIGKLNTLNEIIDAKPIAIKSFIEHSPSNDKLRERYGELLLENNKSLLSKVRLAPDTVRHCLGSFKSWCNFGTKLFVRDLRELKNFDKSISLWNAGLLYGENQTKLRLNDIIAKFDRKSWIGATLNTVSMHLNYIYFNYDLDDQQLYDILLCIEDGKIMNRFLNHIGQLYNAAMNNDAVSHNRFLNNILYQLIRTSEKYNKDNKQAVKSSISEVLFYGENYEWFRNALKSALSDFRNQRENFFAQETDLKKMLIKYNLYLNYDYTLNTDHGLVTIFKLKEIHRNRINRPNNNSNEPRPNSEPMSYKKFLKRRRGEDGCNIF